MGISGEEDCSLRPTVAPSSDFNVSSESFYLGWTHCVTRTVHSSSDRRAPSFPRIWVEVCAATKEVPSAAPQHVLATMLFFLGIQSRATFQHLNSEGQDGGWKKKKLR